MSRVRRTANTGGALALLACATVGGFEGYRQKAYPDPATRGPPWTACYGETKGIKLGDEFTKQQCDAMLLKSLDEHGDKIEACVPWLRVAPRKTYVASLSLGYNIGGGAFCKSTVARLFNEGSAIEACDAFLAYDKARVAGVLVQIPGLTRRRGVERVMCLEGFMEGHFLEAWRV